MLRKKKCSRCKEIRPFEDFWKNHKTKDGLCYYCRYCLSKNLSTKYTYYNNPEYIKEKNHLGETKYSFPRSSECCCVGLGECVHCHLASRKVERALKDDKDFVYEDQIIGLDKNEWQKKCYKTIKE